MYIDVPPSLPCLVVSGSGEAVPSAVPHPPRPGRPLSACLTAVSCCFRVRRSCSVCCSPPAASRTAAVCLSHCRVVLFQGQERLFRLLFPTRRVQDGRCLSVSLPCHVVSGSGEAVPSAVPHPPRPGRPLSACLTAVSCCFRVRRGCSVCCSPPAASRTAAVSLSHCRVMLFQGQEKLFHLLFPTRRVQDGRCLSVSLPCRVVSGSGEAVPSAVPHPSRPGQPGDVVPPSELALHQLHGEASRRPAAERVRPR